MQQERKAIHRDLVKRTHASDTPKGRVTWVTSLHPATSRFRGIFEQLAGLDVATKSRIGVDGDNPGFWQRYLTTHAGAIDDLLHPRQFENLVGDMLHSEGWRCNVTRYSKDGGVDIEASRMVDDKETVCLIQAKRNRSRTSERGKARPVGLNDIQSGSPGRSVGD
jgi:hypothetical protein